MNYFRPRLSICNALEAIPGHFGSKKNLIRRCGKWQGQEKSKRILGRTPPNTHFAVDLNNFLLLVFPKEPLECFQDLDI